MGQALKVIKFDSENGKGKNRSAEKNRYFQHVFALYPLKIAAIIIAILGIISLVLEVQIYFQFRYEIYLAGLIPTLASLILLVLLQTKFGENNLLYITNSYLCINFAAISFISYILPDLLGYNLIGSAIFTLVLSLFLQWGRKNQIATSLYFVILFSISFFLSANTIWENENPILLIFTTILILIISIIVSDLTGIFNSNSYFNFVTNLPRDSKVDKYEISKRFFENSVVPLFKCNLNGEFQFINSSFEDILDLPGEYDITSLNMFHDLVKNENVKEHFLKKIENKGKVEGYRFKFENKNGDEEVFLIDCKSIKEKEEIYIEGSVRNVTKQYKSEKTLRTELENLKQKKRQKDKTIPSVMGDRDKKSNIISRMGHELRTPMSSMLGFLTLIENGLFQNENELKEFSHSAKLSAESLLGLINDVVEISRIQDRDIEITNCEFNLKDEIDLIINDMKSHLEHKELELIVNIKESLPVVIVSDKTKFLRIITNLLRNAIQISEDGKIKLTINSQSLSDGRFKLITSIEDSSEGFDDDKLEQLIKGDLESREKGSKITSGLLHVMICKELANLLDGRITASSEIGKGNTFTFELEVDSGETLDDEENSTSGTHKKIRKYKAKLLLVEDNPISKKVEQKLLHGAGYEVVCVDTASEAIEMVTEGDFDLVLMDIELKDMDGLEATKQIRELPNDKKEIPIVAVTAHSSMKDREKCLLAGMNDYISKPINITFLKMTIDQWLNEANSK